MFQKRILNKPNWVYKQSLGGHGLPAPPTPVAAALVYCAREHYKGVNYTLVRTRSQRILTLTMEIVQSLLMPGRNLSTKKSVMLELRVGR